MMKNKTILMVLSFSATGAFFTLQDSAVANISTITCSQAKINEVLETASAARSTVYVNCNLSLKSTDVVTKRMIFQGASSSGTTLDCNQAHVVPNDFAPAGGDRIIVRSRKVAAPDGAISWEAPSDIIIRNCNIEGSIRIMGMASNGEGEDLRKSSRQDANHTLRARANAPTRITLERLKITGLGRIPLYLSPGVSSVTLKDSKIQGVSTSVAVYLDAESAGNRIINNSIAVQTASRELIAIDGSSQNIIAGNNLSGLSNGGIYLYRNCGEGGTVRHQTPNQNHIINNVFFYKNYSGSNPSIYLGSRQGNRGYCGDDAGLPWGSSIDNGDHAERNVVAHNQIIARSPSQMILDSQGGNKIFENVEVTTAVERPSGCYFDSKNLYVGHGEQKTVKESGACKSLSCNDGVLSTAPVTCPATLICPLQIPREGSCSYDVGLFRDGQRGSVRGYYKYDESCNFSVRVYASYNKADSGYVLGQSVQVVGDRNYRYTTQVNEAGLLVTSSAGQNVCQIKF